MSGSINLDITPAIGLPYISAQQSQKELTHNRALNIIDALINCTVQSLSLTAAPGAPTPGQRWIVGIASTGIWAGKDNQIALWNQGWSYFTPQPGWLAWVSDQSKLFHYTSSGWVAGEGIAHLSELLDVNVATATAPTPPVDKTLLRFDLASLKWIAAQEKLADLFDVDTTAPTDKDILQWSASGGKWTPTVLGLNALGDVNIPSASGSTPPAAGDVLTFNETDLKWEAAPPKLADLTDTTASAAIDGQTLVFTVADGGWHPKTPELATLGDAKITAPAAGDLLRWASGDAKWENHQVRLQDLNDVNAASPADGFFLSYNEDSGKWIPAAAPSGGSSGTSGGGGYAAAVYFGGFPTAATMTPPGPYEFGIRRAVNVASVVRMAAGYYQINFESPMSNPYFVCKLGCGFGNAANSSDTYQDNTIGLICEGPRGGVGRSVSFVRIFTAYSSGGNPIPYDLDHISVEISDLGDST